MSFIDKSTFFSAVHRLLCQMTADACGRTVSAGPIEATVLGNIALQLVASGKIVNLIEARQIIANSEKINQYQPNTSEAWGSAYKNFLMILNSK